MAQKLGELCLLSFLIFTFGCAQQRPVLYPSPYLKTVGQERAEADINDCIRLASEHGAKGDAGEQVAKETAEGGAVGGAVGAGVGAVLGSVGRGAAAGAAGGAAGALTRGLFRSGEPDPVFRGFVDRCLRDKGYEPIGWR
jgi:outer membrane lipoprotein SlyB